AAAHRGRRRAHGHRSGRPRGRRATRADPLVGSGELRRTQPDDAVAPGPQVGGGRACPAARRRRRPSGLSCGSHCEGAPPARADPLRTQRRSLQAARGAQSRTTGDRVRGRSRARGPGGAASHTRDGARERHYPMSRLFAIGRRTFSSLSVANYRRYFFGQSVSLVGTWMQTVAQSWLVYTLTHSATALGFVVALQTLPILVLGPYAGVIADRVDKRRLMIVLQSFMGLQALVLGLLA